MVSQNFYNSIPSLIEVGIAYSINKKMIPIGFQSGNFETDLKGVFNSNQRLAYLDNKDCVVKLLDNLSVNKDFNLMNRCKKNILESVTLNVSEDTNFKGNDLKIIYKLNDLTENDYIFLTYIVTSRTYQFSFDNSPEDWLKHNHLDEKSDSKYRGFLNYLKLKGLLMDNGYFFELYESTVDALETIYKRDKEKIDTILEEYSNYVPYYECVEYNDYEEYLNYTNDNTPF